MFCGGFAFEGYIRLLAGPHVSSQPARNCDASLREPTGLTRD
jgi:hypothetical protein